MQIPAMSRTFSTSSGSFGEDEALLSMRLQPEGPPDAADSRLVETQMPAMSRVLQWVAPSGHPGTTRPPHGSGGTMPGNPGACPAMLPSSRST